VKDAADDEPPTFDEVVGVMNGILELVSRVADRIERLVETKAPSRLIHKEVYILHQAVGAMLGMLGLMEGVYYGYEEEDD